MCLGKVKKNKKVVTAKSSAEAKYGAVVHGCCELMWLKILLAEMSFKQGEPMVIYTDSTSTSNGVNEWFYILTVLPLSSLPEIQYAMKDRNMWRFINEKFQSKDVLLSYLSIED